MTIAIAWRSEGRLHLASDSRISFGNDNYADIGIKVLCIPILVTDANGIPEDSPPFFKSTYGLTYAGSLVNAGTFAELIRELLLHVQHIGAAEDFSFLTICEFLVRYSSKISASVCEFMFERGAYEFFFAGYCPQQKRLRCVRFKFEQLAANQTEAKFTEILESEGTYDCTGSGANVMRRLIGEVSLRPILLAINELIDSEEVKSVGGDIQYGSFLNSDEFGISGIVRKTVETTEHGEHTYGPTEHRVFKYRGFQMYDGWDPMQQPLWVTPSFIELDVPQSRASTNHFRSTLGLPPLA